MIETANWPLIGYGTSPEVKASCHPNTKGSQMLFVQTLGRKKQQISFILRTSIFQIKKRRLSLQKCPAPGCPASVRCGRIPTQVLSPEPVLLQSSRQGLFHSWVFPCTPPLNLSLFQCYSECGPCAGLQTLLAVHSELNTKILSKHLETFCSNLALL